MTKLRLPDRAILADLRHAMLLTDPVERDTWLAIACPDVDQEEAHELLEAALVCHVARKGTFAERRLAELLQAQREAEEAAKIDAEPVDNYPKSVDNPVDNPVDNSGGLWISYGGS